MESYQSLETNKGYGRQREKTWAHQKIQKYQMYFYFNQLVGPAYSTDGEQNAQYHSKWHNSNFKKKHLQNNLQKFEDRHQ